MAPRRLSPSVRASPQLSPEALTNLAASGVQRIISNRPDGEDPGQPTAAEMEDAARKAGMDFHWIPVSGMPNPAQVAAVGALLADGRPTVMFCRSGTRSAIAWAMAERMRGANADDLRAAAAGAGYDLGRLPL